MEYLFTENKKEKKKENDQVLDSFEIMQQNEEIKRQWFVRGGSFIGYAEYARYAMFEPQTKGWVEVRLSDKDPEYIVHRQ